MITFAKFRIIGRIGRVHATEKVSFVSVASDYKQREGDNWKTKANWSSVVVHSEHLRKRLGGKAGQTGNLIMIEGFIRNTFEKSKGGKGPMVDRVSLVALDMEVLHFATRKEGEDDE